MAVTRQQAEEMAGALADGIRCNAVPPVNHGGDGKLRIETWVSRPDDPLRHRGESPKSFTVKDSGKREHFDSGMQRDTEDGKIDYLPLFQSPVLDKMAVLVAEHPDVDWELVFDGPMLLEWAQHLTDGCRKYGRQNWTAAMSAEEMLRFKRSALRHTVAWARAQYDERHHGGVYFNVNGAEFVRQRLAAGNKAEDSASLGPA